MDALQGKDPTNPLRGGEAKVSLVHIIDAVREVGVALIHALKLSWSIL